MAGGESKWKWNDLESMKENALPTENKAKIAREALSNSGAMAKLQSTFGNLQEQLQHLAKRDMNAEKQPPVTANTAAPLSKPVALANSMVLLPPSMHMPAAPQASAAQHAVSSLGGGPTVTLLQQAPSLGHDPILGVGASLHPHVSGKLSSLDGGGPLFDFSSRNGSSQVIRHAVEVFEDPELLIMCDEGLNKQLTRTRDGATEASRIQELAALVKNLRKCVRDLANRATLYADGCLRLEKDLMKQVEGIQLQSESSVKSLEAELAGIKKDLAQYEATFKMDKAKWGADLEDQKYEMMRLKRELDRVTEERDRARDDSKRAEQARQQLEMELKDLKKQSNQQIREVALTQSEAVQRLTEGAEKRETALKEERQRLAKRLDAAQLCIEALQGELSALQSVHEKASVVLRVKTAAEESLTAQVAQLQAELDTTRNQLSDSNAEATAATQQLRSVEAARQVSELGHQTQAERARDLQQRVEQLSETLDAERGIWTDEKQELKTAHQQACDREASLLEEKTLLKTAVTAAITQKEALEGALGALQRDHIALVNESVNLRNQVDFAAGNQQVAEQQAGELQQSLDLVEAKMAAAQEELTTKGARLQDLEGEFSALKEVLGESGQRDVVNNLLRKITVLQNAVASSDATRRRLHNELVQVKGNIRVYCRVKPGSLLSSVRLMPDQCGLQINVEGRDHSLEFDRVYGPSSSQEQVFSGVSELVQSALDGYHVCLFSYGQTGAGKTYTMQGSDGPAGRGIIPRAVDKILQTASELQEQEWEYVMEASCIEIYNNQLRDLLGGPSAPYISDQNAIKHDPSGGHTTVIGIGRVPVTDPGAAAALVQRAAAARSCEATAMNSVSSRSHSVFMLYIKGSHPPSGTQLQGCLCLVDLAGSERLDRSQAEGQRKAEACAINQSLSSIGDVFAALSSKSAHVPYRNSKLTYLLQPCLGGNGKTLMFVNINPEPASAYESLCSLKFASKVNGCETAAKGGAKRYTANSSDGGGGGSSDADAKRLSLPGFPKLSSLPEAAAKRMSMMAPSVGAKRAPLGPPGSSQGPLGMPPSSGGGAKRLRPS